MKCNNVMIAAIPMLIRDSILTVIKMLIVIDDADTDGFC